MKVIICFGVTGPCTHLHQTWLTWSLGVVGTAYSSIVYSTLICYLNISHLYNVHANRPNPYGLYEFGLFSRHRLMYKLYDTWSDDAWCMCVCVCVSVRCMTKLRMAKKHSQIHTLSFVDLVCHSNLRNLLPHGMWHVLRFFFYCGAVFREWISFMCWLHHDVYVCITSLLIISTALSSPTV